MQLKLTNTTLAQIDLGTFAIAAGGTEVFYDDAAFTAAVLADFIQVVSVPAILNAAIESGDLVMKKDAASLSKTNAYIELDAAQTKINGVTKLQTVFDLLYQLATEA